MPFTLAHPALVLPLNQSRFKLSFTALITGSIVPDFEFFFQMREVENIGHHWYGVLIFDVPVALVFSYLFHLLLKKAFIANLPLYYKSRFAPALHFNWKQFASENKMTVLVSVLIGIITHLVWDGFTHDDGMFVQVWPLLAQPINILSHSMPVYYLLQIIFSIAGMLIVYAAIIRMPANASYTSSATYTTIYYWPICLLVFSGIMAVRVWGWPAYNSFWSIVMACMGAITYAWIITTLLIQLLILKKART